MIPIPSIARGSTTKVVTRGTHRALAERETLSKLQPLLSHFGITRVANVTGLDEVGIPTVVVSRPDARSLSVSQGKGLSLVAAKVSGIMEAIEQHHAERVDLPLRVGSFAERRALARVVDVFSLAAYARPFDPRQRLFWVEAVDARSEATVEVPLDLVTLDLRLPLLTDTGFFPIGSNGLASGNTLCEALLHALFELIERDALALFYGRSNDDQSQRRIALDTLKSEDAVQLVERFEAAGLGVALWDMTSDLQVPAIMCAIVERELDVFRPVGLARGYGCHADRDVALSRALCEAAQSRLTRISGSRDDLQRREFDWLREPAQVARHQAQLREPARRDFLGVPTHVSDTLELDLCWVLERLHEAGLEEVLYVDLSRPGLPLHVCRAIVPGLEGSPDVPGYRPGARVRALEGRR